MGVPNYAANGFTKIELGRESRRGKYMGRIVIYWYQIMRPDIEDSVKQC
jgi:hypothetical protein